MENRAKIILRDLVKGKSFDDIDSLISYIYNNNCYFNVSAIQALFEEIFARYNDKKVDEVELVKYHLLVNAIILSPNSDKAYDPNTEIHSVYEMIRMMCVILRDFAPAIFGECMDKEIGIVEVNKNGLNVKHFLYDANLNVGDIVYVGNLSGDSLYIVSDVYKTTLRNLISYIAYINPGYVYKFSLDYASISKFSIESLYREKYVRVLSNNNYYTLKIECDFYIGMMVEFLVGVELLVGIITDHLFFYDDHFDGKVIRRVDYFENIILKERREVTKAVFDYFDINQSPGEFLTYINKKEKYKICFNLFHDLINIVKDNIQKLNLVEEINLYYSPMVNFILENINLNIYYQKLNGICYSVLGYLSSLKRIRDNLLKFLIDKKIDVNIKTVDLNINGFIKKGFAFDLDLKIGDPVLVNVTNNSYIGFVHNIEEVKFYDLLENIEYYDSYHITPVKQIDKVIKERSNILDKVILARMSTDIGSRLFRFVNYVPYIGEIIIYEGKRYVVVDEPFAVKTDEVDLESVSIIEY